MHEATLSLADPQLALALLGTLDQHLKTIRDALDVTVTHRQGELRVCGEPESVGKAITAFEQLKSKLQRSGVVTSEDVAAVLALVMGEPPRESRADGRTASRIAGDRHFRCGPHHSATDAGPGALRGIDSQP